jgi:hypothetical protein
MGSALLAGFSCSVLWILRPERPLIGLTVFVYLLVDARWSRRIGASWRGTAGRTLLISAAIGLPVAAVDAAVRQENVRHYGVPVLSELTGAAFESAYRALLRPRPERPRRHYSVPADARRLAYSVSPAFKSLQPFLEGGFGQRWREMNPPDGLEPDIPDGWFHFALREAAAVSGRHGSATDAEEFYRRIEREIDEACDNGGIPTRRVHLGPLNPDVQLWGPHVPISALWVGRMLLGLSPLVSTDESSVPKETRAIFDDIAHRQRAKSTRWKAIRGGIQLALRKLYPFLSIALGAVATLSLLVSRQRTGSTGILGSVVLPLLITSVLARLLLFTLIDAASFSARGARYMYPAVAPTWAALTIVFAMGAATAIERTRRKVSPIRNLMSP